MPPARPPLLLALLLLSAATADRVAIVGAGAAGLSAAHHLLARGHTDLTLFEATHRAGGLITTATYDNITHDLSTYGTTAAYWRFTAAMRALGAEFCPFSAYFVARSPPAPATLVDSAAAVAAAAAASHPDNSTFRTDYAAQVQRYARLWSRLFAVPLVGPLLQQQRLFPADMPADPDTLRKLATPFEQLLRDEGLPLLLPFFRIIANTQSYGPVDTTSAVYVMSWAPPAVLVPDALTTRPCGAHDSFQKLVDLLVESFQGRVHMRFGRPVQEVRRSGNGKVAVKLALGSTEYFDRVIVTTRLPEAPTDSFLVQPVSWREFRLAKRVQSLQLYTNLMEGSRKSAVDADRLLLYDTSALQKRGVDNDFWAALTHEAGSKGGQSADDEKILREGVLLFYKNQQERKLVRLSAREMDGKVLEVMAKWDDTEWKVVEGHFYRRYFQRWSPKYVGRGFPWSLKKIQGEGGVYLLSSYVCGMESVGHLFDCAKHLIDEHF